ncbi:5-bromo-4-chloroindolyl phosphate hydrolysis family protein [Butyrivibrio sp. JL13D10]|uniref:5-bromo-4-chloroindolyl phosphate hydrolysis family protein n=1 Tax=Butyrivibrio sp. JL13D10 TaxID=3236815 RepID=UPI0038B53275
MSDYDNIYNASSRILKEVEKAVETGNYNNLSSSLRSSINDAVKAAKANPSNNFRGKASDVRTVNYASAGRRTPFFTRTVGYNQGMGKASIGIVGVCFWGIMALGALIDVSLAPAAVFLGLTALSGLLVKSGSDEKKLARAFNKYGKILGRAEYFAISDLAMAAGERSDTVLANIKKMMEKDYLPTARIDNAETTVMLSERAFAQYIKAEKARQDREFAESRQRLNDAANVAGNERLKTESSVGVTDSHARAVINEGNAYIDTIQKLNAIIPGDEMSAKIYQLESIMKKIFTQVEKDPSCADDLRKFMEYYLPTTTKLLQAYADLDKQPEVGTNITKTKKEIEDAMDLINDAFENLLDSLFQDMAWDISSDISVMKTMMAQDGLTQDALDKIQSGEIPTPQFSEFDQPQMNAQPLQFDGAAYQAAPTAQAKEQTSQDGKVELKF